MKNMRSAAALWGKNTMLMKTTTLIWNLIWYKVEVANKMNSIFQSITLGGVPGKGFAFPLNRLCTGKSAGTERYTTRGSE